jgi:hypothetical protein
MAAIAVSCLRRWSVHCEFTAKSNGFAYDRQHVWAYMFETLFTRIRYTSSTGSRTKRNNDRRHISEEYSSELCPKLSEVIIRCSPSYRGRQGEWTGKLHQTRTGSMSA